MAYYGILIAVVIAFAHYQFNYWLWCSILNNRMLPLSLTNDKYLFWKFRNFLISLLHAMITGIGTLICFYVKPQLFTDVIDAYIEGAYLLACYSHGYFIYDTIEMINNRDYKGSKELILHHIMILMCFSITVLESKYVGYCCVALLIELSNVFLHFRQLLLIVNVSKSNIIYRMNSIINVVTFISIRGLSLYWLWCSLILYHGLVPFIIELIGGVSLFGITIMTSVLFVRIYKSDFYYSAMVMCQDDGQTSLMSKDKQIKCAKIIENIAEVSENETESDDQITVMNNYKTDTYTNRLSKSIETINEQNHMRMRANL